MALTGRAAACAFAGAFLVFVVPAGGATVFWVLVALVVAVAVDLSRAASPRAITLSRDGATSTRLGEPAEVSLIVRNTTGRPFRGWVRDAWPPSAGAGPRRHRL